MPTTDRGARYRAGANTLFVQTGKQPSESDQPLGVFDDPKFAQFVADLLNDSELEWDHEYGFRYLA